MQFNSGLTGDAATLARAHGPTLQRLPATIHAFILIELQKWAMLFPAEQRYQRALLEHLSRIPRPELDKVSGSVERIEADAGIHRVGNRSPSGFQDEAQALLRKRELLIAWREAVDGFFRNVDPVLDAQLYPAGAPHRLVVQVYGAGIDVRRERLWNRFKDVGLRLPLNLEGATDTDRFLETLFGSREGDRRSPMLFADAIGPAPPDVWLIESNEALHRLCDGKEAAPSAPPLTGLSYERLRSYRDELTRTLNQKIQSGVDSPQAFAAYARSLQIVPPAGALLSSSDVLLAFVRDVLLTGNGTLFMNNTFVEWATIQALRRAQPRVLLTRYGVRDRLRPFSSMVLFAQPRAADRNPVVPDPGGSFVDVEQLSYYVWLNAEKNAAYRGKTLYLFLAEGVGEMLAIRSDRPVVKGADVGPARLTDVHATMAQWLGVAAAGSGRPIAALL